MSQIAFYIFCSIEPAVMHYFFFPSNGFFSITTIMTSMLGFLCFGLLFMTNRKTLSIVFVLETLIFILLSVWHSYYNNPLSIMVILTQYKEGLIFAGKVVAIFSNKLIIFAFAVLIAKLVYVKKFFRPFRFSWDIIFIFAVPFLVLILGAFRLFHHSHFNIMDFEAYTKSFGYIPAWGYELITFYDKELLFDNIIDNVRTAPQSDHPFLNKVKLTDNIFIVQVESLDFEAYANKVDGKPIMPFLQSISDNSIVFKVSPPHHICSANADFSVLSGATNIDDFYAAVYNMMPLTYYQHINTLPQKASQMGYFTSFYHGYFNIYYNRLPHITAMGFDKIWFMENMPQDIAEGEMGFQDKGVFEFILHNNTKITSQKKFNFIITLSSHSNYLIGKDFAYPYVRPHNDKELYINSIAYVDSALKYLIDNAPDNSLFLIYSDHYSSLSPNNNMLFIVYNKNNTIKQSFGEIPFSEVSSFIHGLFASKSKSNPPA